MTEGRVFAWCMLDGVLHFSPSVPSGALAFAMSRAVGVEQRVWRRGIEVLCGVGEDGVTLYIPGVADRGMAAMPDFLLKMRARNGVGELVDQDAVEPGDAGEE